MHFYNISVLNDVLHKTYNLFCNKAIRRNLRSPFNEIFFSLNEQNKSFAKRRCILMTNLK